jgi:hypothetical protein
MGTPAFAINEKGEHKVLPYRELIFTLKQNTG